MFKKYQETHQLEGQAKRRATQIRPKAVGSDIFGRFSNFDKCRLEVDGDVISGVAVEYVGVDVRATFGESGLNTKQWPNYFTLWPAGPVYASLVCSI